MTRADAATNRTGQEEAVDHGRLGSDRDGDGDGVRFPLPIPVHGVDGRRDR